MVVVSGERHIKQVIVLRTDLGMGKGKLAAQAAHASIDSYLRAVRKNEEISIEWMAIGMPKTVLKVESEKELIIIFQKAKDMGLPASLITDAGKTQIEPGTKTCVGIGPAFTGEIDRITGELRLL